MAYNGWKLDAEAKSSLLEQFPPRFADVIAHHVTLKRGKKATPNRVVARVVGYAVDEAGVEALVVEIDGTTTRDDGRTYHITWSIDREAGFKPVSSNELLKNGFTAVEPIVIKTAPFFVDDEGNEHILLMDHAEVGSMLADIETERVAVERCRAEGYEDPYFVGTKGYPNWHDFTDAAIAKTRAFVAETQAMLSGKGSAGSTD